MHSCRSFRGKSQSSEALLDCQGRVSNVLCHNWVGVVITLLCGILPPARTLVSSCSGALPQPLARSLARDQQATSAGERWPEPLVGLNPLHGAQPLPGMRHDTVSARCTLPRDSSLLVKAKLGRVWERSEAAQQILWLCLREGGFTLSNQTAHTNG